MKNERFDSHYQEGTQSSLASGPEKAEKPRLNPWAAVAVIAVCLLAIIYQMDNQQAPDPKVVAKHAAFQEKFQDFRAKLEDRSVSDQEIKRMYHNIVEEAAKKNGR